MSQGVTDQVDSKEKLAVLIVINRNCPQKILCFEIVNCEFCGANGWLH